MFYLKRSIRKKTEKNVPANFDTAM